jgi:hypothetical protein
MYYASFIATFTVSFIVAVSMIRHVIIKNDFTYKSILVWVITGVMPYIAAFIYIKTKKE